jgi:uncharacterized protein (TIGR02678 family)
MTGDPQGPIDARIAARHLMQRPLTCAEHDPEVFRLIRRHAATLDRWFTQRFGDRVHVDADTARLYKSVAPPADRPLRTSTDRPLRPRQYVLVALCLGAVSSGPDVISLAIWWRRYVPQRPKPRSRCSSTRLTERHWSRRCSG